MKGWIARDEDGGAAVFASPPRPGTLIEGSWQGDEIFGFSQDKVDALAKFLGVEPGFCQPIELTAVAIGPAIRGKE